MKWRNNKTFNGAGLEWTPSIAEHIDTCFFKEASCFELDWNDFRSVSNYSPSSSSKSFLQFLSFLTEEQVPILLKIDGSDFSPSDAIREIHSNALKKVLERLNCVEFSGSFNYDFCSFMTREQKLHKIVEQITEIQEQFNIPFALENKRHLEETDLLNRILKLSGCRLLLDLSNLYLNSVNENFNPYEWLLEINLDHVSTIHLSGCTFDENGTLVEAHEASISEPVWELLESTLRMTGPVNVIVERNEYFECAGEIKKCPALFHDVRRAQRLLNKISKKRSLMPLRKKKKKEFEMPRVLFL